MAGISAGLALARISLTARASLTGDELDLAGRVLTTVLVDR
jgi:hypothetical protein